MPEARAAAERILAGGATRGRHQGPGPRRRPRQGRRRQAGRRAPTRPRRSPAADPRHGHQGHHRSARSSSRRRPTSSREFYMSAVLDRAARRILLMGSAEGGVEIEQVAVDHPEAIIRHHADPLLGLLDYQAREFAFAMGLGGHLKAAVGDRQGPRPDDARLRRRPGRDQPAGHRPRAGPDGAPVERLVCLDAKVTLDDSALPRHPGLEDAARPRRRGPRRPRGARGRPDLHQARRHDRLHGQRRRPGDDHDGPRQARRRRAGQLPRHRRRGAGGQGRGGDADHPGRSRRSTPSWSTSSAASPAATRSPAA